MQTKLALLILSAFLITNSAQAKKILIRLNLQKGASYEMNMVSGNLVDQEMMGQKMVIDQKLEMDFLFKVLEILPDKNFLIECSTSKIKMDMKVNDQNVNLDSASPDESNPMNVVLKGLVENRMKFELSPKGEIGKIEGLEEYSKKLSGNPQLTKIMYMFSDEKSFKSFMDQWFNYFSEVKIAKGDKWNRDSTIPALMSQKSPMNFEVASLDKKTITLNIKSDVNLSTPLEQAGIKIDMKATGSQTGTITIDSSDGWFRQSNLTQAFEVNMKMKNPQTGKDMEIPMKMKLSTKTSVAKK